MFNNQQVNKTTGYFNHHQQFLTNILLQNQSLLSLLIGYKYPRVAIVPFFDDGVANNDNLMSVTIVSNKLAMQHLIHDKPNEIIPIQEFYSSVTESTFIGEEIFITNYKGEELLVLTWKMLIKHYFNLMGRYPIRQVEKFPFTTKPFFTHKSFNSGDRLLVLKGDTDNKYYLEFLLINGELGLYYNSPVDLNVEDIFDHFTNLTENQFNEERKKAEENQDCLLYKNWLDLDPIIGINNFKLIIDSSEDLFDKFNESEQRLFEIISDYHEYFAKGGLVVNTLSSLLNPKLNEMVTKATFIEMIKVAYTLLLTKVNTDPNTIISIANKTVNNSALIERINSQKSSNSIFTEEDNIAKYLSENSNISYDGDGLTKLVTYLYYLNKDRL